MAPGSRDTATTAELVVTAGAHARALKPSSTNQRSSARGHANWSPTLSNRSLPSAVGNGFRDPETGGAETPKRGASARSETHNPKTPSPKSLKRPTFLHSALETQTTQSAWWTRLDCHKLSISSAYTV